MNLKKSVPIIIAGFFLLLDQFLKFLSIKNWAEPHLLNRYFGWEPFKNPGVAFSLPLPNYLTIFFTLLILAILIFVASQQFKNAPADFASLCFIIAGALSNLIDRLIFKTTLDYWRIFTGVINLADILITLGFVGYLYFNLKRGER